MADFQIFEVPLGNGHIGICQMPGRNDVTGDLDRLRDWGADLVLSMTSQGELNAAGVGDIGQRLADRGIGWQHLPIVDFGAPGGDTALAWPVAAAAAHEVLQNGGRVVAHCWGGCGRSGMAVLRLMVETGEPPKEALARLRSVRPCAVETEGQWGWASGV